MFTEWASLPVWRLDRLHRAARYPAPHLACAAVTTSGADSDETTARFEFAFEPRFRAWLLVQGVTPRTAWVTLSADTLVARFGPWVCEADRANVSGVELSGPYRWYRAIGARLSLADHGLTFGTTTAGGVCMTFHEPVKGLVPFGRLRHPGLTLTVQDRDRLASLLQPGG